MNLKELRKLVSKLNKDDRIVGVYKMNKAQIIEALQKVRYRVDEENKRLVPTVQMKRKKIIKLTEEDMRPRQRRTVLRPPQQLVESVRRRTPAEREARVEEIRRNQERRTRNRRN
jgi:hypothetical protein